MNKRKIREILKLTWAILFIWLYIPHIILYFLYLDKGIKGDMIAMRKKMQLHFPLFLTFLSLVHNDSYYRNIFYHRIGAVKAVLISWWRPGNKYLIISKTMKLGEGVELLHPFSTVLFARYIGKNFSFRNCTTVGAKADGCPTIGDNVTLGVNVCIIGNIKIGNNVTIGAGSVVTKDIPSNCIVVGNPAKVIKYL